MLTDHWKRIESDNKELIWAANLEKCVAMLMFRPLEEQLLSQDIPNTEANFEIIKKAGLRLRLPEYGYVEETKGAIEA